MMSSRGRWWPHNNVIGCAVMMLLLLSLLFLGDTAAAINSPSSTLSTDIKQPFQPDVISNFINHRCGSKFDSDSSRPSIWTYEGTLTDPLSGKVIAEVEGLELLKQLPMITSSSSSCSGALLLNNLCARNVLFPKGKTYSSQPPWDTATTILSRKLFCYRRPTTARSSNNMHDAGKESKHNTSFLPNKSLLTSLRLRPDGPLRHLSPLENMAIYDSAITYITRNNGREMLVFSELGGGQSDINDTIGSRYGLDDNKKHYVMGSAQRDRDASSFSFVINALKGVVTNDRDTGPMLPPLKHPSNDDAINNGEVIISPPRSRLLQFGKGDGSGSDGGSASDRKYRSVRETYSFSISSNDTNDHSAQQYQSDNTNRFSRLWKQKSQQTNPVVEEMQTPCTVKYTRYGEAPPWYAPGRMCTLELYGKRVTYPTANDDPPTSLPEMISPLLSWAVSKCKPSFCSGWPSVSQTRLTSDNSENELAEEAVRLFCSESRRSIFPDDLDLKEADWASTAENTLSKMQRRLKILSKSFIVSKDPSQL